MKLPNSIALASLFSNLGLATITFQAFPAELNAGSIQQVEWTQDHDYQIQDFWLVHGDNGSEAWDKVESIGHEGLNGTTGTNSIEWKVPAVKDQADYQLWMQSIELIGNTIAPNHTRYAALTNHFAIVGGPRNVDRPTLYPKEIAGIVLGSLAGLMLLAAVFAFGARMWRKSKSLTVDLSEPEAKDVEYLSEPEMKTVN